MSLSPLVSSLKLAGAQRGQDNGWWTQVRRTNHSVHLLSWNPQKYKELQVPPVLEEHGSPCIWIHMVWNLVIICQSSSALGPKGDWAKEGSWSKSLLPKGNDDTPVFKRDYVKHGPNCCNKVWFQKGQKQKKTYSPHFESDTQLTKEPSKSVAMSSDRTQSCEWYLIRKARDLHKRWAVGCPTVKKHVSEVRICTAPPESTEK